MNNLDFQLRFAKQKEIPAIIEIMKHYNMHHVPSPEMKELDYRFFIVAELDRKIIGAAGFTFISADIGKTTLMAVLPEFSGSGIGYALQKRRMEILRSFDCNKIITNADRPETIAWYKKHFGYTEVGKLPKIHSFGLETVDEWTTLEADLAPWGSPRQQSKTFINAALTGMVHQKNENPFLPVTPEEIVTDAVKAAKMGAAIVHLHARDIMGQPVPDPEIYRRIIGGIRENQPELIICVTTSGRNFAELEKRAAVLTLEADFKPDMASLTLGSFNFPSQPSINASQTIQSLAKMMLEKNIRPELEVFEAGMIDYAKYLFRKGFLRLPMYYNFLLGSLGTLNASGRNLDFLVSALPNYSYWGATGIGSSQWAMECQAMLSGGGVRVGLEDNLYLDQAKSVLASNEALIQRVLDFAGGNGISIASAVEMRQWLELE